MVLVVKFYGRRNSDLQLTSFDAAVLYVDTLTQRAARAGPDILERFNRALNQFFCRVIELVAEEGGDVVSFAGDAVLALFPAGETSLAGVVARAARCGINASGLALETEPLKLGLNESVVRSRITLACGNAWLKTFGRPSRRRHILLAGSALERLASIQGHGPPGSVAVERAAWASLQACATFVAAESGAAAQILTGLSTKESRTPLLPVAPDVPNSALLVFLPSAIAERIANKQSEWLAEMRFVCPIFVSLATTGDRAFDPERIADAVLAVEDIFIRFGGELLQVRAEHGIVGIGIFGTPGSTHEDDALRATRAACELRNVANATALEVSVGVCSGSALCGVYGDARRQDYGVIGDVMNLSARLMQRHNGVLSDQTTAQLAGPELSWSSAGPVMLRGFDQPIKLARLEGPREQQIADTDAPSLPSFVRLVGRAREQARIDACLRAHAAGNSSEEARTLLIEGEAGMGKSMLARFALQRSQQFRIPALLITGSRIERLTPYYVWRAVLQRLLAPHDSGAAPSRLTEIILSLLARGPPELLIFASLLRDILPIDIAPTELTRQMEPSARATMTARLLIHLLEKSGTGPLLVIFDDAHWIDSASWSGIVLAARRAPRLLLLLTMRPESTVALSAETQDFLGRHLPRILRLEGLSEDETATVVSARLEVDRVSSEVSRFIRERSGGNPFFAEELALVLRERGQLRLEADACITATALDRNELLDLPNTIRATILERIDRLSAHAQLLLKIASVIGAVAPMTVLSTIFGAQAQFDSLGGALEAIQIRMLADVEQRDGEAMLCFRHSIIQESAYSMLTPSQRRALHGAVALWYERVYADHLEPWLPLLAHHFRAADEKAKALVYLGRAGEQALQAHANKEAVQFLEAALGLEGEVGAPPRDCAQRRRSLAEAYLKLSQLATCRNHLLAALALVGQPLPHGSARLLFNLAGALVRTLMPRASAADSCLLTAQLHQLRAEVAYFEHDTLALLHGTLAGLRDALKCGPSRELASAHGTAAIVFGLLRLRGKSKRHIAAAIKAAAAAGHAPTEAYIQHLACVCASAIGDWDWAEQAVRLAAEGYRRVGDQYRWQSTRMILAYQALHRGEFEKIDSYLAEADEHTVFPGGPLQLRTWFRTAQLARANACALAGAPPPANALIHEVQLLGQIADPSQVLLCRGFAADALLLHRDFMGAQQQAELGLEVLLRHVPTTYFSLFGITSIGNTFISLAELGASSPRELRDRSRSALTGLKRFAFMVPIAGPCVLLQEGRMRLVDGDARGASRRLRLAVHRASGLGMKGVEAAARRALDRLDGKVADNGGRSAWA